MTLTPLIESMTLTPLIARANKNAAASFGKSYENLDIPNLSDIKFEKMDNKSGRVTFFGKVALNSRYLRKLTPAGRLDLLNTIFHESSHFKQMWGTRGSDKNENISHAIGDSLELKF